jgi:hypothetical protein
LLSNFIGAAVCGAGASALSAAGAVALSLVGAIVLSPVGAIVLSVVGAIALSLVGAIVLSAAHATTSAPTQNSAVVEHTDTRSWDRTNIRQPCCADGRSAPCTD